MKVLALRRTSKSITARTTYIYTFKGTTSLETLHAMACHFVMTFFFISNLLMTPLSSPTILCFLKMKRSFQRPSLLSRLASSQLVRHFVTKLCEPFTLETKAGSAGQVPAKSGYPFFDDRVVVKAKRVTLFPETIFSHIKVALPRSQVFPVYPAMQWHLKLLPSTEQVALL